MTAAIPGLHAIIPAGGAGTRLWPLSRADRPKFLLDLTGSGRTLLQQTYDRLAPLVGAGNVHVVTGDRHAEAVAAQLPQLSHVVAEPSPRDSMPAIGLATALVARRDPDAVVGSFAADHVIEHTAAFAAAVTEAVVVARAGHLCTIGISPTSPSTAYGYVEAGGPLGLPAAPNARQVETFVEKPDRSTAAAYLASGGHWWNAGMYVVRADVLLRHLAEQQPRLAEGVVSIAAAWHTDRRAQVLAETWPRLTRISVDHALAEPVAAAGGVAVVPADLGWDDLGDFAALDAVLARAPGAGPVRTAGANSTVLAVDAGGLVIADGSRLVAVAGIEDVVVVETADALLVTTKAHAQQVRDLVEQLGVDGREDLL